MIHFQTDHEGATLRATELKPKLDKYLVDKEFNNEFERCKELLVGYSSRNERALRERFKKDGFRALDYKVCILGGTPFAPGVIKNIEEIERIKYDRDGKPVLKKGKPDRFNYPCFFGNMGEKEKKLFSIYDSITLQIASFTPEIIEAIKNNICQFFAVTNFGTRQSKGFGSFYIHENDPLYRPLVSTWHFLIDTAKYELDRFKPNPNDQYYSPYEDKEYYKLKYLFKAIALFYSTIRSGYNFGDLYFKSLMFIYAKQLDPPQQWDKRTLRESLYSTHPTYIDVKSRRTDPNGTVQYNRGQQDGLLFRDLLGLSTEQDWMNYGDEQKDNQGRVKMKGGKIAYGTDKLTKKETTGDIARFRSPITFKPIRETGTDIFKVHIFANEIPEEYLGRTFTAKSGASGTSVNLKTPDEFDIKGYLEFCFKDALKDSTAFEQHINNNLNNKDAKLLASIYDELRKQ